MVATTRSQTLFATVVGGLVLAGSATGEVQMFSLGDVLRDQRLADRPIPTLPPCTVRCLRHRVTPSAHHPCRALMLHTHSLTRTHLFGLVAGPAAIGWKPHGAVRRGEQWGDVCRRRRRLQPHSSLASCGSATRGRVTLRSGRITSARPLSKHQVNRANRPNTA